MYNDETIRPPLRAETRNVTEFQSAFVSKFRELDKIRFWPLRSFCRIVGFQEYGFCKRQFSSAKSWFCVVHHLLISVSFSLDTLLEGSKSHNLMSISLSPAEERKFSLKPTGHPGSHTEVQSTLTMLATCRRMLETGHKPDFLQVMTMCNKCGVSDERDRIYAVLAITAEFHSASRAVINVDYTVPLQEAYTDATSTAKRQRNDLEILCQCNDPTLNNVNGMPFRCPDYSAFRTGLWAEGGARYAFHTGSLWNFPPNIEILGKRLLALDGFCVEMVARTATTDRKPGDTGLWAY